MKFYHLLVQFACTVVAVNSHMCDDPWIDDFPQLYSYPNSEHSSTWSSKRPQKPTNQNPSQSHTNQNQNQNQHQNHHHHHHHHHQHTEKAPVTSGRVELRPLPRPSGSVPFIMSKNGENMNSMQEKQIDELRCLEILDNLIATQWQEDLDVIPTNDLRKFSAPYIVPEFKSLYSNPESQWIQEEGMALNKLDKCFRNLVSKVVPRMKQDEIQCLNKMYPDYLWRENKTAIQMNKYMRETSREEPPFKSFYTYFELTELLFQNRIIESLDAELAAIYEDMDFYVESEEDKAEKRFVIDQDCDCKDIRILKEARTDDERFKKFAQIVKSDVNNDLVAEFLRKWVPGVIIPQTKYSQWTQARNDMETRIQREIRELQNQRKDAQSLCLHAAKLAKEFFTEQKKILFDEVSPAALSSELKIRRKYAYASALADTLAGKNDNRLSRVKVMVKEFEEGYYCLTNFIRMIENHQRYMIASAFVNEALPYGYTYCRLNKLTPGLFNPRYCKCQGTFCEESGLANVRAERFQLNQLPNGTWTVSLNTSYREPFLDEFISNANQQVADQKFDTWWYQHQRVPVLYV